MSTKMALLFPDLLRGSVQLCTLERPVLRRPSAGYRPTLCQVLRQTLGAQLPGYGVCADFLYFNVGNTIIDLPCREAYRPVIVMLRIIFSIGFTTS